MRILQVTPHYEPDFHLGGVVRSTSILCRELVRLGHEVTVYTTRHASAAAEVELGRPVDMGGVEVVYFRNVAGAFGFGPDMVSAARGVDAFDVVHVAAFWQLFGLPVLLAARRRGVPAVMSPRGSLVMVHDRTRSSLKHRALYWALNHHLLKRADALHFTAEVERADAAALRIATPSFCVPNALPLDEFEALPDRAAARAALGVEGDRAVIVFLGRLDRRKALDVLVRAFARLSGRARDALLVLAGPDFGEESMLRALVAELGVDQRVRFTGLVGPEERARLLAAADVSTLTSLAENFGNAAGEAMAAGLPVVVSEQCGIAEGIEEARVGRVVPVREEAISQALDALLADRDALREAGARAVDFARQRYAAAHVAEAMATAYADIVHGERSAASRWR